MLCLGTWLPHPVVWMGGASRRWKNACGPSYPKTPRGELLGGGIVAAVLPLATLAVTGTVCTLAAPGCTRWRGWLFSCSGARSHLRARGLVQESRNVYKNWQKATCPPPAGLWRGSLAAIPRISRRKATKVAVETVAENASDGVIAPLFYMLIGGARWR